MLLSRRRREDGASAAGGRPTGLLPMPERRAAFRDWRRRRPFWSGVLLMAAGVELLIVPLSPFDVLLTLGIGGIAAIGIGAALVVAGVFLWAAPHAHSYVSVNAMILSVLSFAATNLGGFLVGTVLGITGSALGFGWTPQGAARSGGEKGAAPDGEERDGSERDGGTPDGSEPDGSTPDGSTPRDTEPASPERAVRRARRALSVLLPFAMLAALGGAAVPEARAASADGAPQAAATPPLVTATRFSPQGFTFAGVTEIPTARGPLKVIELTMRAASLTDYRLRTRDGSSPEEQLTSKRLDLIGNVKLYLTKFSGCIEGLICITFTPDRLPPPPVIPPFVFLTKVEAEQALVLTDRLLVDDLNISTAGAGLGRAGIHENAPAPGASPSPGNSPLASGSSPTPGGTASPDPAPSSSAGPGTHTSPPDPAPDPGPTTSGRPSPRPQQPDPSSSPDPTDPGRPRFPLLEVRDPERERTDTLWCEKVGFTVTNTGDAPSDKGEIVVRTRVRGLLGHDWGTTESKPSPFAGLAPGKNLTLHRRVCVDPGFGLVLLSGGHLEHEITVTYAGGEPVKADVPRR